MEGALLAVAVVLVLGVSLAARTAWRWADPPYRGVHERGGGRHRHRDWEGAP